MTRPTPTRRGDRGQAGGIEVLGFSLLVLVGGVLVLVNAWGVVDARFAADTAAREAVRWLVESAHQDRPVADLVDGARGVAVEALGDDRAGGGVRVEVSLPDGDLGRCARVVVGVHLEVPALGLPFIDGFTRPVPVTATHGEVVDPARSGVGGSATCIR